jgi:hypothetical protein
LAVVGERLLDLAAVLIGQQPFDHAAHVGLVIDRGLLGAGEHRRVLSEHPRADRVKGRRGHPAGDVFAEQVSQPQSQLAGGPDAEGDREDLPRVGGPCREQSGDAVNQCLGLPGAGPGDQQQRPGAVADGLRLLWCQARQ